MINEQKVPRIRFAGFTDAWEQRKLGELVDITTGKLDANAMKEDGEYDFYTSGVQKYKIDVAAFEGPAITIAGNGATVGYMHFADGKFNAYQRTYVLSRFQADRQFLFYEISNKLPKKIALEVRAGSIPYIVLDMLTDLEILLPSENEQNVIGRYMLEIDTLITLHQRKCDTLRKLKQSMLQKMFPKEGEKVPEIRFAGFTDAWEQRKLSEAADIIGGGTPSTGVEEYWDGDIDWYTPAEINDQLYVDCSERKITRLGLEKSSAKILPANKTVLFTSRAGIGKTAILRHDGATNQGFQSMVLNDETNPYFVFSMSSIIKEKAERVASGSTFAEISGKLLGNLEFWFPSKAEQDKIGGYFENLDHLIILHQRKLETAKKLKKAMLQKMFT